MPLYNVTIREDRIYEMTLDASGMDRAVALGIALVETGLECADSISIDAENCGAMPVETTPVGDRPVPAGEQA